MYTHNQRLHFSTDEAYSGLAALTGIMQVNKDSLVLEYQVKDNILGMLKSDTKRLLIPYNNLTEVRYKRNWFISRFHLYVNSMQILGKFPIGKDGRITLKINRKRSHTAKELESYINLRLSEIRLEMLI